MVGLQTLDLAIGVRVPASQPTFSSHKHSEHYPALIQLQTGRSQKTPSDKPRRSTLTNICCCDDKCCPTRLQFGFPAAHLTGLASRTVVKINSMRPAKLD
jgi:hypothetical protein